jgi:hypothetical protein
LFRGCRCRAANQSGSYQSDQILHFRCVHVILPLLWRGNPAESASMKKNPLSLNFIPLLIGFALFQPAHAVVPPPDGGYTGGNTAEGQNALLSLTTGGYNTAIGFFSLRGNTIASGNTAIGAGALLTNTGDQNTATGIAALLSNTTGKENTANGALALLSNTTGGGNAALGFATLSSNTTGLNNTATGNYALLSNSSGEENTANGSLALQRNTTGNSNTAIGSQALYYINGSANTAVGIQALQNASTGSFNTALGAGAGANVTTASGVICIGNGVGGADIDQSCFIGNIYGVTTQDAAVPVYIDDHGQLGTASSSRRYKTDIKPLDKESESIVALKPVSFHYKGQKDKKPQFGLIAEEVAEVNRDLVIYDSDGKPYTVRYDAVNAMLLNEFLKEHAKMEQLKKDFESKIAEQQKEIKVLTAGLQKVSAEIQMSKTAPQTVLN